MFRFLNPSFQSLISLALSPRNRATNASCSQYQQRWHWQTTLPSTWNPETRRYEWDNLFLSASSFPLLVSFVYHLYSYSLGTPPKLAQKQRNNDDGSRKNSWRFHLRKVRVPVLGNGQPMLTRELKKKRHIKRWMVKKINKERGEYKKKMQVVDDLQNYIKFMRDQKRD